MKRGFEGSESEKPMFPARSIANAWKSTWYSRSRVGACSLPSRKFKRIESENVAVLEPSS